MRPPASWAEEAQESGSLHAEAGAGRARASNGLVEALDRETVSRGTGNSDFDDPEMFNDPDQFGPLHLRRDGHDFYGFDSNDQVVDGRMGVAVPKSF
jgi:hypothetical protein